MTDDHDCYRSYYDFFFFGLVLLSFSYIIYCCWRSCNSVCVGVEEWVGVGVFQCIF